MIKQIKMQVRALKHAIEVMKDERRKFAPGHVAFERQGIRPVKFSSDGIVGENFGTFESDHKKYLECNETIRQLEDMIEIITDPPVVVEPQQMTMLVERNKKHA